MQLWLHETALESSVPRWRQISEEGALCGTDLSPFLKFRIDKSAQFWRKVVGHVTDVILSSGWRDSRASRFSKFCPFFLRASMNNPEKDLTPLTTGRFLSFFTYFSIKFLFFLSLFTQHISDICAGPSWTREWELGELCLVKVTMHIDMSGKSPITTWFPKTQPAGCLGVQTFLFTWSWWWHVFSAMACLEPDVWHWIASLSKSNLFRNVLGSRQLCTIIVRWSSQSYGFGFDYVICRIQQNLMLSN